jgi:microcystin-dependent protein
MHQGAGVGLTARTLGEIGGQETVTLTAAQMPAHSHTATVAVDSLVATTDSPQGAVLARNASATPNYGKTANATLLQTAVTVASSGGGQPHPTMPPFACVNFIIALTGIFPSQN